MAWAIGERKATMVIHPRPFSWLGLHGGALGFAGLGRSAGLAISAVALSVAASPAGAQRVAAGAHAAPPAQHASPPPSHAGYAQQPRPQNRGSQPSPSRSLPQHGSAGDPSRSHFAGTPQSASPGGGSFPAGGPPRQTRPLITAQPPGANTQARPQYATPPPNGVSRRTPIQAPVAGQAYSGNGNQHLGSWLANHNGQSFQDQQRSLQREPGFNRLPQGQQQKLINHLHQLDTMPPTQRQRTLDRIENMERLSPGKRQEVRSAAQQLSQMPPARKSQVQSAFRQLRELPPAERQNRLSSPAFRSQYTDGERAVLGNLLSVEPYEAQRQAPHP